MHFLLKLLLIIVISGISTVTSKAADPVTDAQTVIESQIQAFLKSDAEKAYSFASPAIQKKFPDKDQFFQMVQNQYAPVYHPGNYAFGRNKVAPDASLVFQEVLITGTDGKDWTAIYQLNRQDDGSLRINGVSIIQNTTSSGI